MTQASGCGMGRWSPLLGLIAMVTAALLSYWKVPALLGWPVCGMQRWFGLPCPLCGGTRALESLARGEWVAGLLWNPLVIAACGAVVVWFGVWAVERMSGWRWERPAWRSKVMGGIGVGLVVLNWLYLVFFLPG